MLTDDSNSEKKRQNNLFSFLSNGKHHLLSSMGYNAASKKGTSFHWFLLIKTSAYIIFLFFSGTLITKGIFGAPLKSASMCSSCNESGLFVPDPVYRCFEEIIKRGKVKFIGLFDGGSEGIPLSLIPLPSLSLTRNLNFSLQPICIPHDFSLLFRVTDRRYI
jgi:hypothetical protein